MGLEELRKEILEEAEKRVDQILSEARAEADKIIKDAEKRAEAIRESRRDGVIKMLREKEESELALARIEGKRLIHEKKWGLINDVFDKVLVRLREFQGDNKYYEVLGDYIVEGVKALGVDEAILMVNGEDYRVVKDRLRDYEKRVSKELGRKITLRLSDENVRIIGGVIVSDPSRRVLYNLSFDSRLKEAREKLAADILDILFGGGG
jgi:V/A-type H+-transporting ATPase subunit E